MGGEPGDETSHCKYGFDTCTGSRLLLTVNMNVPIIAFGIDVYAGLGEALQTLSALN